MSAMLTVDDVARMARELPEVTERISVTATGRGCRGKGARLGAALQQGRCQALRRRRAARRPDRRGNGVGCAARHRYQSC